MVLAKRRNGYQVLLTDYMLECMLPLSAGIELKPEQMVSVTLQHVNPRQDKISIFIS
jgi:exoribonuclease-2